MFKIIESSRSGGSPLEVVSLEEVSKRGNHTIVVLDEMMIIYGEAKEPT